MDNISFTGLTIPRHVIHGSGQGRRIAGPYPSDWTRLVTNVEQWRNELARLGSMTYLPMIDSWVNKTISGEWGQYISPDNTNVVLFFKEESDAVVFKLMGGLAACFETPKEGEVR